MYFKARISSDVVRSEKSTLRGEKKTDVIHPEKSKRGETHRRGDFLDYSGGGVSKREDTGEENR